MVLKWFGIVRERDANAQSIVCNSNLIQWLRYKWISGSNRVNCMWLSSFKITDGKRET